MKDLSFADLERIVLSYNAEEIEIIRKAYDYASSKHSGQKRQSGEDYIIHPLNVAYVLAEMHADRDTVCAGLLHDTLEDTNATKEEIATEFNQNIANLVDGVTKISKLNFSSKQEQNYANTRKIITSITDDVRIIIIKLADRLHNMRTLEYKSEFKQKENALETMEIFVPLAYYIGAYRIKSELEDIAFRYLKSVEYLELLERNKALEEKCNPFLEEMRFKIKRILDSKGIPNEIKIRTKNIYGIYRRLEEGYKLSDIHDLFSLKIMVDEIDSCYRTLGFIHSEYLPFNSRFKDYICNPKTNMYQGLHTTVFGPNNMLVQTQVRTFEMDRIASFGLTAYWDINKGRARDVMQDDLRKKYQFFKSLVEINRAFGDNQDFVRRVKEELFSGSIYVYTPKGERIQLPKNSTVVDFAYDTQIDLGNIMVGAIVNDEYVTVNYVLKNNDRVRIITDELSFGPRGEWEKFATSTNAKRRIREFNGR